eukprot:jgi/Ulvmu1/8776/UM048_0031.1
MSMNTMEGEHAAMEVITQDDAFNDRNIGIALAVCSSAFIGASFIIKKKGLRIAGNHGVRAGAGGLSYLRQPVWWAGMLSMAVGELANFVAYAYAPAIIVTPLGALSVIVAAVLAHYMLKERLNTFGALGCFLCVVGSIIIVMHAPPDQPFTSITQIRALALQPQFLLMAAVAAAVVAWLVLVAAPREGGANLLVYIAICSAIGGFTVISCKALGIALKLTATGRSQLGHADTYIVAGVTVACITTQMYYLNRALDTFNTAIVTPVYYVMFTACTLAVSCVLFAPRLSGVAAVSEACGFAVIVAGTFLLHSTKDLDAPGPAAVLALGLRGATAAAAAAAGGGDVEEGGTGAGGGTRESAPLLLRSVTSRVGDRDTR